MAQDETYQTKVYLENGAGRMVAGSGGEITLESGAVLSMISSANLGLAGADVAADDARRILASEFGGTTLIETGTVLATESVLAISNVPRNERVVKVLGAISASQPSIWLTSVSAGRELYLMMLGDHTGAFTANETGLTVLTSGCIILGSVGDAVASFVLYASVASCTMVHLTAIADDVWSIVGQMGYVKQE